MVAPVIVVFDQGCGLRLEIARQEVVLDQDAVFEHLVPTFDLTLGLGMVGLTGVVDVPIYRQSACSPTR